MIPRTRALQLCVSVWAAMLLVSAAYVFVRPRAALDRWLALQAEAVTRGGGGKLAIQHSAATTAGVDMYASAVIGVALAVLVLALLWRAGHLAEARILALFLSVLQYPGLVMEAAGVSLGFQLVASSAMMFVAVGAFVRFAAVFPRPLRPVDLAARRRWVRGLQALALRPAAVWGGAAVAAAAAAAAALERGSLGGFITITGFVPILVGVSLLRRSYQVAAPEERRQLLWVVQGFYMAVWVLGLGFTLGMGLAMRDGIRVGMGGEAVVSGAALLVTNLSVLTAMLIVLCSLAFAIFYHGALEPGLVIQKTTVYGILTVVGAATFGLVENLASDVVLQTAGLPESWGGPIAGAVVAGAVTLLRQRVGGWVSRRFPSVGTVQAA